jgi:hypothetical protein
MSIRPLLLRATLVLALAAALWASWLYYQRVARWTGLVGDVRTYLQAARAGDSVEVRRRALNAEAAERVLGLARVNPAMMDTLITSLDLIAGDVPGYPTNAVVATFRTRSNFCRFSDGNRDEFQVTAIRTADGWRYTYSGVTPC